MELVKEDSFEEDIEDFKVLEPSINANMLLLQQASNKMSILQSLELEEIKKFKERFEGYCLRCPSIECHPPSSVEESCRVFCEAIKWSYLF